MFLQLCCAGDGVLVILLFVCAEVGLAVGQGDGERHKVSYAAAVVPGEVRRDFIIIILNNPEFPHFQTNWTLTLSFGVHWNGLISIRFEKVAST